MEWSRTETWSGIKACRRFSIRLSNSLKSLFSEEFAEPDGIKDALKKVGLALADKASHKGGRIEYAKKIIRLEQAEAEYSKLTAVKLVNGINGRIATMWKGLESLLFAMSQADKKYTMDDYWNMSVYQFMRYKQLLIDYRKKTAKAGADED